MALPRSHESDKNIVDRRRASRGSELARTVRSARDRLANQPGNVVYDRELLKLHARAAINAAPAIPLLVALIAAGGLMLGLGQSILIWAAVTICGYAGLAIVATHTSRADPSSLDPKRTAGAFLLAHAISGVGWIALAHIGCGACGLEHFAVIKAAILLFAIAATAITAYALRWAVVIAFSAPIAMFVIVTVPGWKPVEGVMTALLVLALPFFTYVASSLNRSVVNTLAFRNEKDALIAELETAKGISDEARRRAEDSNLAKSRFLATMSHELRTPLNAILGFSEVMAKEVLGPLENAHYREYAGDIHDSGQHLLNLINEILDLSRIEAGRYQLNEQPVGLAQVVGECCDLVSLKARNKDLRLIQQFEDRLPRLFADERSVRQIALNLLSNAVKFAPAGGEVRVRVGWTAGGGQYLAVKDNGPGIPEEEIPVVLSAFGQGSIAIKNAEQGTGLGLPIVQGLLSLHGGTLELNSKLREGTEAIAIFPAARAMDELPAVKPQRKRA